MVLLRMKEDIQQQRAFIHKSYYILKTRFLSFFLFFFFSKGACSLLKHCIFACHLDVNISFLSLLCDILISLYTKMD